MASKGRFFLFLKALGAFARGILWMGALGLLAGLVGLVATTCKSSFPRSGNPDSQATPQHVVVPPEPGQAKPAYPVVKWVRFKRLVLDGKNLDVYLVQIGLDRLGRVALGGTFQDGTKWISVSSSTQADTFQMMLSPAGRSGWVTAGLPPWCKTLVVQAYNPGTTIFGENNCNTWKMGGLPGTK